MQVLVFRFHISRAKSRALRTPFVVWFCSTLPFFFLSLSLFFYVYTFSHFKVSRKVNAGVFIARSTSARRRRLCTLAWNSARKSRTKVIKKKTKTKNKQENDTDPLKKKREQKSSVSLCIVTGVVIRRLFMFEKSSREKQFAAVSADRNFCARAPKQLCQITEQCRNYLKTLVSTSSADWTCEIWVSTKPGWLWRHS